MALTHGTASVFTMQEVAQNTIVESTNVDISNSYDTDLYLKQALTSETAHTGTLNVVQVNYTGDGDQGWVTHAKWVGPTGTGNTEATTIATGVGTTSISYASQTGYDMATKLGDERWRLIEDATFANSEFWEQVAAPNATQSTTRDPLSTAHAASSTLHNIAASYCIKLPIAQQVRVIADNTYDSDGSTVGIVAQVVKRTGL